MKTFDEKLLDILIESEHDFFPMKKTILDIKKLVKSLVPNPIIYKDGTDFYNQSEAIGYNNCTRDFNENLGVYEDS